MRTATRKPPHNRRKFGNIWGELAYLCAKVHHWLHERGDRRSARRFETRLDATLKSLPPNDLAIVRQEGWALLYELQNDLLRAIGHRRREIELMELAQRSVQKSVAAGDYGQDTADWVLAGRDAAAIDGRRAILRALEDKLADSGTNLNISRSAEKPREERKLLARVPS